MQKWNNWIEDIIKTSKNSIKHLEKKILNLSNLRGITFLLAIFFAIFAFNYPESYVYHSLSGFFMVVFILIAVSHKKLIKMNQEKENLLSIVEEYRKKKDDNLDDFEFDGTEYQYDKNQPRLKNYVKNYLEDLHIIGDNSLFKFLNVAVSKGGRLNLFQSLSNRFVKKEDIKENQDAVEELSKEILFILHFQEQLRQIPNIKDRDLGNDLFLMKKNNKTKSLYTFIISIILSLATISSLTFALLGFINLVYFEVLFIVQLLFSLILNKIYSEEFNSITYDIRVVSKFKKLFNYVSSVDFKSLKNIKLKKYISNGRTVLDKLVRLDNLDSLRKNIFSYIIFNIFFAINGIIAYKYYSILDEDKARLIKSIKAVEEFEKLLSLCTINLIKGDICKPEILEEVIFECSGMLYPLMNEKKCVSNDFMCREELNIITGSNMSGKTSFMRSVGVNLVLTYAGAFANANKFNVPIMKPFTSINVKDDINNGISTFYGELLRIKDILKFANKHQETMIIFIDEIFKGTNYADRIFGAKKVLEKLAKINCIVFLTTHDFELCEVNDNKLKNYHFFEEYINGKMVFNHKINTGKCESTNAKELMHEIGIV